MRFRTVAIIVMVTLLVLVLGLTWQVEESTRLFADLVQFVKSRTIQPNAIETEQVAFTLTDETEEVSVGEENLYTIYFLAKKNLKGVRIVGTLGETKQRISPSLVWDLGNISAGGNFVFKMPIIVQKGEGNLVISRLTVSAMERPVWWAKERRKVLATVDDINQLLVQ